MEIYSNTFPDIEHDPECAYLAPTGGGNQQLPDDQRSAAESFDTVIRLDGSGEADGLKDNEDIADMSSVADEADEEDHSRSDSQHSIKSFIANADDGEKMLEEVELKDEDVDDVTHSEGLQSEDIGNTVGNTFVINDAPVTETGDEGGNTSEAFFENETIFASSHTDAQLEDEVEDEAEEVSHITSQSSGDNFLIEISGEKSNELPASEPVSVSETITVETITVDTTGCDTVQTALEAGDTTFDTTFDESVASGTDQSEPRSHQPLEVTHSTAEISFEQALEEREQAFLSELNATDDEKASSNVDNDVNVDVDASPWSTNLNDSSNPWDTTIDTNVDPFSADPVQTAVTSDPFGDTVDQAETVDPFGDAGVNNNDPFGFNNSDPFGESGLVQSESVHSVIPNPSAPFELEVAPIEPEVEPEVEPFNILEDSESDAMPALAKKKRELVIPVFDIPCPGDDDYNENQIPVAVQPPTPMNITPSEERNKFPFPAVTGGSAGSTGSVNVAMTAAEELEKKVEKQLEEAALMLENIEEAITKSPSPTDFMMEAEDTAEATGFEQKELDGYIKFESEPESELFNPPPLDGAADASEVDDQLTKSCPEADEDIIGDHADLDADADDSRAPLIPGFKTDHVEPFSVRLEEKLLNDFLTEYKTEIKNNLQTARVATNNLLEHQPVRRVVSDSGAYAKDRSDSYQESTETKLESLLRSSSTEQKPDLFADIPMPIVPGSSVWDAPPISKIIVPENPLFSMPQMSLEEVMKEDEADQESIPITMTRSISTLIDPSNITKEISPSLSLPDLQREYELSSLIQKMSKTPEPTLTMATQNEPELESHNEPDLVRDQMDFDSSFIGK